MYWNTASTFHLRYSKLSKRRASSAKLMCCWPSTSWQHACGRVFEPTEMLSGAATRLSSGTHMTYLRTHKHKTIKGLYFCLPGLCVLMHRGVPGWHSWLVKKGKIPLGQIHQLIRAAVAGAAGGMLQDSLVHPRCYWSAIARRSCTANNDPNSFCQAGA